ncbi:LCP family protein [Humibacter ginsenosidimutans]|uniref:LytR family transcriptional regulator n=1 Tax=Humibacter ginsenosidimutans TaxID=2599293 RepID=A0A5B8M6F2_9MICO|nr:LCP family protein [Humibacter ginsenosidimutans]QDZ15896.1 LytR family transcriptional regulator [Humibacter ginsenosidimutans]
MATRTSQREQPGPRRSGADGQPTGQAESTGPRRTERRDESAQRSAQEPTELRTIARHGKLHRKPWATFGKVVASVATVALVSVLGIGAVAAANLVADAKPSVHLVGEKPGAIPDIGALDGGVNILLTATDTRTGQGGAWGTTEDSSGAGLNDVTMLVHLSQDHTHAVVVSFPRDLMLAIPECPDGNGGWNSAMSLQPLNTTLSDGGVACTVLTIEQLTGIKIPFAGVVDFSGVVAMSNAVGGVPVCITGGGIHDEHTNLDLPDGTSVLKGMEAAEFLRTRYGVGDGSDLGRISNTQVFLSSLVRTVMTKATLTDPVKVWGLAKAALAHIQWSDSLNNVTTLYQIVMAAKDIDFGNIVFVQYPVGTDPDDPGKVIADDESAATLMDAVKNDQPIQLTGGTGVGSVDDSTAAGKTDASSGTDASGASSKASGSASSSKPKSSASAAPPVALSEDVKGQTAATQTCSKGNN